jgi:hypothetical protein
MSEVSLDKDLELMVSFEKAGAGSLVSDACLQEIANRLRVAVRSESVVSGEVKIAGDAENILTKNNDGELRVQQATIYSESQDVPVPDAVEAGGDSYLVPVTRYRITSVIMASGDVIPIEYQGQTVDDDYPATLTELVDNLNAESAPFTWSIEGGVLVVASDLGLEIEAILEGGSSESDTIKKILAEQIQSPTAGDVELTFEEARSVDGIDYASQFLVLPQATPGDGFEKIYITSISSSRVKVKITKVSKVLEATLKVFTPAQREDSSEF